MIAVEEDRFEIETAVFRIVDRHEHVRKTDNAAVD
jgi:hypothetical protein